jgi:hypothetical protein
MPRTVIAVITLAHPHPHHLLLSLLRQLTRALHNAIAHAR